MEELIDLIATDGSPSSISNSIKQLLYTKASEKVDLVRPEVASSIFGIENETDTEGEN